MSHSLSGFLRLQALCSWLVAPGRLGAAPVTPMACLAQQGRTVGHGRCRWHSLSPSKGLGSASELPSHARGAALGQGTADPSVCITAPWGQVLAPFVSFAGAFVHICSPSPGAGGGRRGQVRNGSHPTVYHPSLLLSRESPRGSGSPDLGPSPGQTPCEELESWVCLEEGTVGLCFPSPMAGTAVSAAGGGEAPQVWQRRRDGNWSCKSFSSGGAPVATAVLRGQEGAEELVCNGEVQAVSSYEVANGERKENKALQEGRKQKAGERKGEEGAKQRGEIVWKREMEPGSLQLWLITAPCAWCLAVVWQCPPGLAVLLFLAGCSPLKPSFPPALRRRARQWGRVVSLLVCKHIFSP